MLLMVIGQLICIFVFAYALSRFSLDVAHDFGCQNAKCLGYDDPCHEKTSFSHMQNLRCISAVQSALLFFTTCTCTRGDQKLCVIFSTFYNGLDEHIKI